MSTCSIVVDGLCSVPFMLDDAIPRLTERLILVMLTFRCQGFKLDGVASESDQHSSALNGLLSEVGRVVDICLL